MIVLLGGLLSFRADLRHLDAQICFFETDQCGIDSRSEAETAIIRGIEIALSDLLQILPLSAPYEGL